MNIVEDFKNPSAMSLPVKLAYLFLFAALLWLTGAPLFISHARASQLTTLSDKLQDSNMNVAASSTIAFTTVAAVTPSNNIKISWDPTAAGGSNSFSEVGAAATTSQMYITVGGSTDYDIVSSCTSGNQVTATANYTPSTDENLTFTLCAGASQIGSTTAVVIGIGPNLITNPSTVGSYVVRVSSTGPGTLTNTGDARVAIISNVTVTASVDTTLTFTVSGMGTSTTVNGTTTTDGSTATLIPFSHNGGSLQPNTPEVASQRLNVATNASQGFTVTVHAGTFGSANGGALTSSGGDTIDFFKDGQRTSTPSAWTAPSNVLSQPNTYGHFGVTTSDSDGLNGLTAFGANNWVGDFYSTTTQTVLTNPGPSDGIADSIGSTTVGYAIQIGSLQPAGSDYQTTLTYVATPVF